MRIAYLSPLPPAKTGVAHYSAMLLPALRQQVDVDTFCTPDDYPGTGFDHVVYQLGNNPHHEWIYAEAMRKPGVVVLHDLVLHHLIVEMTIARGDVDGYVDALRASHGEAGAAWARGRAAGMHHEMGNFLMPASTEVANRSRAVIVHNHYAADRLRALGVTTPVHVIPHPFVPERVREPRESVRARLGFAPQHRVIGLFGFLTSAKRAEVAIEAFRRARERNADLRMLIVGEPAPNVDLSSIRGEGIVTTGYVEDDEFGAYYAAADRIVNLRYPSAGEASGTLIRALQAGKPVAVSDYAQFAEFPDSCVVRIPFGAEEIDALASFFTRALDTPSIAAAQQAWLEANLRVEQTVAGYLRAFASTDTREVHGVPRELALFPTLTLVDVAWRERELALTVCNEGDITLRARTYGEPGYRTIALLSVDGTVMQDRWLQLNGDLAPGATATMAMPVSVTAERFTLRLYHALEGISPIEPRAWAEREVVHVR